MTDYVQLQADIYHLLLSADTLADVNVVQFRKLRIDSQADVSTLWQMPRNGKAGIGILVEMPEVETAHANLPGPEFVTSLPLSVVEEPNLNFAPGGSYLSAEEVAQRVAELLHGYQGGAWGGQLHAKGAIVSPDATWPEGLLAYKVTLHLRLTRDQVARVATPTAAAVGTTVTLACDTAGAALYYTLDGSFPGAGNPAALPYSAPFAATVGQTLRFAAYKSGLLPSQALEATINAD
jgi:hypothetical protein